jgi:hypothetical protein
MKLPNPKHNMGIPAPEPLAIVLRAYAESEAKSGEGKNYPKIPMTYSNYAVVFDTETKTDPSQQLRIGTYRVYKGTELIKQGLFYDPLSINSLEMRTINDWGFARKMDIISVPEFIETIVYKYGYDYFGTIIGFNLPFDISRIAINHASAKANNKYPKMRGGFTFQLIADPRRPWLQVKYLNRNSAIFRFTRPAKQLTPRGERNKGFKVPAYEGRFIDIKTLAASLRSHRGNLDKLCKLLKVNNPKRKTEQHGGPITTEYLNYAATDALATWECYATLIAEYNQHGLPNTAAHLIKSEAGIGKAYLKEMGIQPWRQVQPDFPPELLGIIMSTYFGGRSEVHIRRTVTRVLYCDFLSMYPTVCTLMGLWRWVIAEGMSWNDSTKETRSFLEGITVGDMVNQDLWPNLTTLVQILPEADILPVRAAYGQEPQSTIGLNHLTSPGPLWYTLADCIAAKLLSGKPLTVIRALTFTPKAMQSGLKPIKITGNDDCEVNPRTGDFYKQIIDRRRQVKDDLTAAIAAEASEQEVTALESQQMALKILANATAYGIFVQLNVDDLPEPVETEIYGAEGKSFKTTSKKREKPGEYFHPILATFITGAARLMLAMTERLILNEGLDWVFCDTDSMAIAKPPEMVDAEFEERANRILGRFAKLNPYSAKGELLKVEEANFALENGKPGAGLGPLHCFAISAKRYVLFNVGPDGLPIIRKASAHGLGHLKPPYSEIKAPRSIPKPAIPLSKIGPGLGRWHHDLWFKIVEAALVGTPNEVDLSYHKALNLPAVSHYSAVNPGLLKCFEAHNDGKDYRDRVRPFGFMVALHPAHVPNAPGREDIEVEDTPLPKTARHSLSPFAPFEDDPEKSVEQAFDRKTGEPVPRQMLATYKQALSQYHMHPETKFADAESTDIGPARRRHILATAINYIGKEADRLEEQLFAGLDEKALVDYGPSPASVEVIAERVRAGIAAHGQRAIARVAGMSLRDINQVSRGSTSMPLKRIVRLTETLNRLEHRDV